ncbi:hypothetical protein C3L33_10097, partial [Rhododendron williamsianum]
MAGAHLPLESYNGTWIASFVLLTVPLVVASGYIGLEFQLGFMELFFLGVLLGSNSTSSVSSEEGSGAQLDEIDWRSRLVGGIIRGQEEEDISGITRRLLQWKPELIDKPYAHGWIPLHYTMHRGASSKASENALVTQLSRHRAPVCGMEFNALTPNHLASGLIKVVYGILQNWQKLLIFLS